MLNCKYLIISFAVTFQASFAQDGYKPNVEPLTTGVYVHQTFMDIEGYEKYPSNGLIVEGDSNVWMIDAGWTTSQTTEIIEWIETNIEKPIEGCIITHAHEDRTAGISVLRANGIAPISSELVAQKAMERGFAAPDVGFDRMAVIEQPGIDMFVYYPGPGHTEENLIVLVRDRNVLFGGCFIKDCETNGLGNTADANLELWRKSLLNVKAMMMANWPEIEWIVPGHGTWNCLDAVDHTLGLLKE